MVATRASVLSALVAALTLGAVQPAALAADFPSELGEGGSAFAGARQGYVPAKKQQSYTPEKIASAFAQWAIILPVFYAAYGNSIKTQFTRLLVKAGAIPMPGRPLIGRLLVLTLDIGREKDTWMEPSWARSGRRLELGVAIRLAENGVVEPVGVGAYSNTEIGPGTWEVTGGTLRFNFKLINGINRGDITFPEGETMYFRCQAWGATVATKGTMLVRRSRWVVRQEWRTTGKLRIATARNDTEAKDNVPVSKMRGLLMDPIA